MLTKNEWQDNASVNADADDDGHEIPAQTLERFSKIIHFQDLAGNLEWGHSIISFFFFTFLKHSQLCAYFRAFLP